MLEILAGSAILVAIFGLALPRIDGAGHRLDREARSLALVVESARGIAVHRDYPVAVSFEIVPGRLRLHHDLDADGRIDPGEETLHLPLHHDVAFGTGGAPPVRPRSDPTDLTLLRQGRPTVVFEPDGSASETGVVHLTARRPANVTRPSEGRALLIEANSGGVECLSYRSGTWEATC
jgi:hypothetical protein